MSNQVGTPEERFTHVAAHIVLHINFRQCSLSSEAM